MFPDEIQSLARAVVEAATRSGRMIVTAESCTGGLVAGALTAVPGSSAALDRGFVTYSNAAKSRMLGIPADLIAVHGAVSREVAMAMAQGALAQSDAAVSVAVTGIAGPGGGSPDKPVGRVHFAAAGPAGVVHRVHDLGDPGRESVRLRSVVVALELLMDQLA
ncbi:nicotinamide-nucleotide amidohydrolase family protein [Rhizobium sp. CRIBSB]|nr:nicotinamide-nucleotide amidohydrolase family protein [Rhizobium sp. CRIBSB]